jgi:hypothetical protein
MNTWRALGNTGAFEFHETGKILLAEKLLLKQNYNARREWRSESASQSAYQLLKLLYQDRKFGTNVAGAAL